MMPIWLITGATLFILELATRRGYAFWSALAALLVAFLRRTYPQYVTFPWQMGGFFAGVIILSILWRLYQKNRPQTLFHNSLEMIGTEFELTADTKKNYGKIKLNDVTWYVSSHKALTAGTRVVVYGVDGVILKVKPR